MKSGADKNKTKLNHIFIHIFSLDNNISHLFAFNFFIIFALKCVDDIQNTV